MLPITIECPHCHEVNPRTVVTPDNEIACAHCGKVWVRPAPVRVAFDPASKDGDMACYAQYKVDGAGNVQFVRALYVPPI